MTVKKIHLAVKIMIVALFGILGSFSIIMAPILITAHDIQTATIGYFYLGISILSILVIYAAIKNEFSNNSKF